MSDQNTSLPVRTQADGTDERLHVKIVDGSNPSVHQTAVDSDKNLHVEIHGNDPANTDRVVRTAENGALTPDGVYDLTTNTKPGNLGLIASTRAATPGDTTQTQRITSVTNGDKRLLDVSMHDENGAPYGETNPLPVTITDSEGNEIHHFLTSASVAVNNTVNLDYLVSAGKTLKLRQVFTSASGKIRVEVKTSQDGVVFTTRAVRFNSTSSPEADMIWSVFMTVASTVRISITNRDNQPQDVYATVVGYEV